MAVVIAPDVFSKVKMQTLVSNSAFGSDTSIATQSIVINNRAFFDLFENPRL